LGENAIEENKGLSAAQEDGKLRPFRKLKHGGKVAKMGRSEKNFTEEVLEKDKQVSFSTKEFGLATV